MAFNSIGLGELMGRLLVTARLRRSGKFNLGATPDAVYNPPTTPTPDRRGTGSRMPGRIGFEIELGVSEAAHRPMRRRSDTMRILVLGDFSGRRNRGIETAADLADRRVLSVDLDSFDSVFRAVAPGLSLEPGGMHTSPLHLGFESLEDFHPDRLYGSLEPFRELRLSRQRLLDPATFEAEAARLIEGYAPAAGRDRTLPAAGPGAAEDQSGLLERLIGAAPVATGGGAPARRVVDDLVRTLVEPHIKPGFTRAPDPYVSALDASATELMQALMHESDFQALEAAWRGLRRIVDSVELGSQVELWIADVSKDELLEDLEICEGQLEDSAAYRLIVERSQGGIDGSPWSVLLGNFAFGADQDDIALLGHLGRLASCSGGPLLAAADPALVGCGTLDADSEPRKWAFKDAAIEERWNALRRSPLARWLGLALPRILLRLPYGRKTDGIDSFEFEELSAAARHEDYLWGNPALACGLVMARRFLDEQAEMNAAGPIEIEDLPACVRDVDGERRLLPCAEFQLPVRIGEELQRRGLIPLLSHGDRNAVRIFGLKSISQPPLALAGLA
jgi:type VI secretion system protein ImpC